MLKLDISNISSDGLSVNRFIASNANLHPYVKGYFYVFIRYPEIVRQRLIMGSTFDNNKLSNIMLSLCEGYTPAGDRQLKYEDVVGIGDVGSSFITGQTIDRNFSLAYREVWGSPILKVNRVWTSIIDPIYGGLVNQNTDNSLKFLPSTYKGKVFVIQTKPIALYSSEMRDIVSNKENLKEYIIKADLYMGVFPTTDLSSMYDSNITDNSIVRPTIQCRFDGSKYDESVDPDLIDKAADILSNNILTSNTMDAKSLYTDNI